jgi:competence protein ComEA
MSKTRAMWVFGMALAVCIGARDTTAQRTPFERIAVRRAEQPEWQEIINSMIERGAEVNTEEEFYAIAEHLAEHLGPTLNVNTAGAADLALFFWIPGEPAAAIVDDRAKNGPLQTADDLRKVPGVDFAKIEPARDSLTF